jgi:alpha-N-arabinofuranosidase
MQAHNTFENPSAVKPAPLNAIRVNDGKLTVTIPARSVAVLKITE